MIEIVARFVGGRSVFIAGETIEVDVTVNLNSKKEAKLSSMLAWLSAQVHVQCSVFEEGKVKNVEQNALSEETSFMPFKGEKGSTIYSSKPTILSCNHPLDPQLPHTVRYRDTLPCSLAPSFRGSCLKYSHKVSVGAQVVGRKLKVIRLPFRVLVLPGLNEEMKMMQKEKEEEDEVKPTNPFFQPPPTETSVLDIALETIQSLTCRKNPGFYNITNKGGRVMELMLLKQSFRLGDDVVAQCSFEKAQVPTLQFSVTLQCVEQLLDAAKDRLANQKAECVPKVTSFSKHEEFCLCLSRTSLQLPISLTNTPAFQTDLVSVTWRLHFEFVTMISPRPEPTITSDHSITIPPKDVEVEVMVWDLPIKIFPTNPSFVNKLSLTSSEAIGHL